jgi:hypothetical protein
MSQVSPGLKDGKFLCLSRVALKRPSTQVLPLGKSPKYSNTWQRPSQLKLPDDGIRTPAAVRWKQWQNRARDGCGGEWKAAS